MTTRKRSNYSTEFKTRVVLELLQNEVSIFQISIKYNINTSTIRNWERKFMGSACIIFSQNQCMEKLQNEFKMLQKKRDRLLEQLVCINKNKNLIPLHYSTRTIFPERFHYSIMNWPFLRIS